MNKFPPSTPFRSTHSTRSPTFSPSYNPPLLHRWNNGRHPRLSAIAQIRFNSNTAFPALPTPPTAGDTTSPTDGEFLTDSTLQGQEYVEQVITEAPRVLGVLKSYGVDFGWGTSTMVQWAFEHIYVYAGTPFWATIMLVAFAIRVGTFPLVISASDTSSRMGALKPLLEPLNAKMKAATASRDQLLMQRTRLETSAIYKDNNVKIWKLALPFLQMPLAYGAWRLAWKMADMHVPGMSTGGILWFQNLTVSDPYFVLPLFAGFFQHLAVRLGGETGAMQNPKAASLRIFLMYFLPGLGTAIAIFAPASVQITYCTSSLLVLLTGQALRNEAFRKWLKIAPVVNPSTSVPSPYQGTITVAGRAMNRSSVLPAHKVDASPKLGPLERLKPSNVTAAWGGLVKSTNDWVGELVPGVQNRSGDRKRKLAKAKADAHEQKRRKEIEAKKAEYHKQQRENKWEV